MVSVVEQVCLIQAFHNLTSVMQYFPKPRPYRTLLGMQSGYYPNPTRMRRCSKCNFFEPRLNRTLLGMQSYYPNPAQIGRCLACNIFHCSHAFKLFSSESSKPSTRMMRTFCSAIEVHFKELDSARRGTWRALLDAVTPTSFLLHNQRRNTKTHPTRANVCPTPSK